MARGWLKYLVRRDDVESVRLYGRQGPIVEPLDVVVHFTPFGDIQPGTRNVLYLQNAFPPERFDGGTPGVFRTVRERYDAFLFTSRPLRDACAEGAVIPFATDPEVFTPQTDDGFAHPVVFVGNDIRGTAVNHRYMLPALEFGLVVYGNRSWRAPFARACRGKIASEDLPRLYGSALVNLNAHIAEHVRWDTVNLRVYDVLACRGFLLSDRTPALESEFSEAVVCTEGDEDMWAKLVRYLADPTSRRRIADEGYRLVHSGHTYAARVDTLMRFLGEVL